MEFYLVLRRLRSTSSYRRFRKRILSRDRFCAQCRVEGRTTLSRELDHIERPRSESEFWDPENAQGLCARCHGLKTRLENRKVGEELAKWDSKLGR